MESPAAVKVLLESLLEAEQQGWATAKVSIDRVLAVAGDLGYDALPARSGTPQLATLASVSAEQAYGASLSAVVGLGSMPLHSDGAHLADPPDVVILQGLGDAEAANTLLWHVGGDECREDMEHGVFAVRGQVRSFCAHAFDQHGRVRFDPLRMKPRDASARRVVEYFASSASRAHAHCWSDHPDRVLIIDNRRTVHGRTAVSAGATRTLRRLMLRRTA